MVNIRIFYEHLISNRLPSMNDVTDYLSRGWKPLTIMTKSSILDVAAVLDLPLVSNSIKFYELSRKNTWESCLRYDDKYRILQHLYDSPWCFGQRNLHEVTLLLHWTKKYLQRHNILAKILSLVQLSPRNMLHTLQRTLKLAEITTEKRAFLSTHVSLPIF